MLAVAVITEISHLQRIDSVTLTIDTTNKGSLPKPLEALSFDVSDIQAELIQNPTTFKKTNIEEG